MPPSLLRNRTSVLGTTVVVGVLLTTLIVEIRIPSFKKRQKQSPHLSKRRRSTMARLRAPSPPPKPYGPRDQVTWTARPWLAQTPNVPAIKVTTPDTYGNRALVMQSRWNYSKLRPRSRNVLELPSRRWKRTERLEEGPNAHWHHRRPSFSQRVSRSQPPIERMREEAEDVVTQMKERHQSRMKRRNEEETKCKAAFSSRRAKSAPPPVEHAPESWESLEYDRSTRIKCEDEESVERGRRMVRGSSERVESFGDRGSLERRGRSRGPRPVLRGQTLEQRYCDVQQAGQSDSGEDGWQGEFLDVSEYGNDQYDDEDDGGILLDEYRREIGEMEERRSSG